MPSRAEIVTFADDAPPPGADPWLPGAAPAAGIEVTDPDPGWPGQPYRAPARLGSAADYPGRL